MLEAIEKIEKYASKGKQAANQLSTSVRQSHKEIPWSIVTAMRNVLRHHYFGLDLDKKSSLKLNRL